MFQTKITELFGIKYPILAGPMGPNISDVNLVAAVSNAGGLGIFPAVEYKTIGELRDGIRQVKDVTDKPFALNVTLVPYYTTINFQEYFSVAIEEGIKIVETSARNPEPYVKLLREAGIKIIHRATRIKDIQTAERAGVDAVTILGIEAGGLPGIEDVTSLVRIPTAAEAVNIPVIAGGGIADARGFVAALALGAEGILMGTRFMLSAECRINPQIKEWLLQRRENETVLIERSIRNPSRVVRTEFSEMILEREKQGISAEELRLLINQHHDYSVADVEHNIIGAGQVVGLLHDVPTVSEIIESIIHDAGVIVKRLGGLI